MLNSSSFVAWLCIVSLAAAGERADIVVAKDGSGDFKTIQAAINAVLADNHALKIILIKNGVYVEKLMIKTNFIVLVGEDRDSTRIQNDLSAAPNAPKPEDITPTWTFAGAWDPEVTLPPVLPMAFLLKPDNNKPGVALAPKLTWVSGRNAKSHRIYFGTSNPPQVVAEVSECFYKAETLRSNTVYYWRVDEVTDEKVIEGKLWQFRTR